MDEIEALAICFGNIKVSRGGDLMKVANALAYLKSLPHNKSNRKVADRIGVSTESVRQHLLLLDLPGYVQEHLASGVLGLDKGRLASMVNKHRPDILPVVLPVIVNVPSKEARDIVEYLVRNKEVSVEDAVAAVEAAKTVVVDVHYVATPVDTELYEFIQSAAIDAMTTVDRHATSMVAGWIESGIDRASGPGYPKGGPGRVYVKLDGPQFKALQGLRSRALPTANDVVQAILHEQTGENVIG